MKKFALPFVILLLAIGCNKSEKETISEKSDKKSEKTAPKPVVDDPNKTYIYLTFDDGPVGGTMNILNIAKEKNVPVTFFEIGQNLGHNASQWKILADLKNEPNVTVANHSYTHASGRYNYFYSRPEVVLKDFLRSKDSLKLKTQIARMPGRNIWRIKYVNKVDNKRTIPAADLLAKNGFEIYGWDVEWHGKHKTLVGDYEHMFNEIKRVAEKHEECTPKHIVLLTHDYYFESQYGQDQLRKLIDRVNSDSAYAFRKIEDYPQKPFVKPNTKKPADSVVKKLTVKSAKPKTATKKKQSA